MTAGRGDVGGSTVDLVRLSNPARLGPAAAGRFTDAMLSITEAATYRVGGGHADICARYCAARYELPDEWDVMPLRSGTNALLHALHGCGVLPGQQVLVPDVAFAAVAGAVMQMGAQPVVADVTEHDWNLDSAGVATALGRRAIAAVIAVDNYGTPCDLEAVHAAAAEHGVPVVLDACESLGASRAVPAWRHCAAIAVSFSFTKPVHAAGMGGALMAPRATIEALAARAELLTSQLRLPELNAAFLVQAWPDLDTNVTHLRAVYDTYAAELGELGLVAQSDGRASTRVHAPFLLPCAGARRQAVVDRLAARGVEARGYFRAQSASLGLDQVTPPCSRAVDRRVLCLPTGPALSGAMVDRVVDAVRAVLTDDRRRSSSG